MIKKESNSLNYMFLGYFQHIHYFLIYSFYDFILIKMHMILDLFISLKFYFHDFITKLIYDSILINLFIYVFLINFFY
jgi:hypothetical protein